MLSHLKRWFGSIAKRYLEREFAHSESAHLVSRERGSMSGAIGARLLLVQKIPLRSHPTSVVEPAPLASCIYTFPHANLHLLFILNLGLHFLGAQESYLEHLSPIPIFPHIHFKFFCEDKKCSLGPKMQKLAKWEKFSQYPNIVLKESIP